MKQVLRATARLMAVVPMALTITLQAATFCSVVLAGEQDDRDELARIRVAMQRAQNTKDILALEPKALAYAGSAAKRKGKTLLLHLHSGRILKYADPVPCEGDDPPGHCEEHRLIVYHRSLGLFIVCVAHYEGGHYLLIDDNSGDETRLPNFPSFSPSGNVLVSFDDEGDGGDIDIWDRQQTKYVWEWSASPFAGQGGTSYRVVRWVSDDKVDLEAYQSESLGSPEKTIFFSLVREQSAWAIAAGP